MQQEPNTSGLVPLSDAADLEVAKGSEDVRGWEVRTQDNERVGTVKDLIVDPGAMRTRYLDVQLDSQLIGGERRVLVPVGVARLQDDNDVVVVGLSRDEIVRRPAYDGRRVTSDTERGTSAGDRAADLAENVNDRLANDPRP